MATFRWEPPTKQIFFVIIVVARVVTTAVRCYTSPRCRDQDVAQGTLHDFGRERKALGGALASGAFVPSSNSARLLSFLCEKYFEDPGRELTEYEIALGALGRRSDFDSRNDSAVRVELHRLRKRLKEFYEAEGAALPMQIVLPPGQYAPQFLSLPDGDSPAAASLKSFTARRSSWIWLGLLAWCCSWRRFGPSAARSATWGPPQAPAHHRASRANRKCASSPDFHPANTSTSMDISGPATPISREELRQRSVIRFWRGPRIRRYTITRQGQN